MFYYEANMLGTLPAGWVLLHAQSSAVCSGSLCPFAGLHFACTAISDSPQVAAVGQMRRYKIPWRGDAFTNDTTVDGGDLTGGWIGGGSTSE